jgi:hypothetical protein
MESDLQPLNRVAGQRGYSVPFESGHLLGSRVRQDVRDGLVALLRDFSNSGSTYVVPWAMVPRTVVMTWFDGALHSRVAQLRTLSPSAIQQAADEAAAAGEAGHAAQSEALAMRRKEEDRLTALVEVLSGGALRALGISVETLDRGEVSRQRLEEACRPHGFGPEDLVATLEACAKLVMPVGIPASLGGTMVGPLRMTLEQLQQLVTHLDRRIGAVSPAERDLYGSARMAAEASVELAASILARVDAKLDAILETIGGWKTGQAEMTRWLLQLEMILDGWPSVLGFHAGVIDPPAGVKGTRAASLAAIAPTLAGELLAEVRKGGG